MKSKVEKIKAEADIVECLSDFRKRFNNPICHVPGRRDDLRVV